MPLVDGSEQRNDGPPSHGKIRLRRAKLSGDATIDEHNTRLVSLVPKVCTF